MSTNSAEDPVDQTAFRKLMSLFATGVCVISFAKEGDEGAPNLSGMTVNSLVSVSLDPMLVCWSLQNDASQYDEYAQAKEFAISILADDQQALARRYAARGDTATNAGDFTHTERGLPVIKDAIATIECSHWAAYPAGDHTMILGEVQAMKAPSSNVELRALGFFGGRFLSIGA